MENVFTQTAFDKFLTTFDADRQQAGAKYELLRSRLIKFFEWRGCEIPEELTDEVFDRVVKKIQSGEQIQNINAYAATVAQFVFKEDCRRRERHFQSIDDTPELEKASETKDTAAVDAQDARLDCLEKCLLEFSVENRKLIVAYHDTDERTMISTRKRLAESLGVSLNVLRIRVCRLKSKLENCVVGCCGKVQGSKLKTQV